MVQKSWTSLAVLLIFSSLYPARNVLRKVEEEKHPGKEFTFSLGQCAYDGEIFYVGAQGEIPDNDYDKSFVLAATKKDTLLSNFAPKKVQVDGIETATSPLHGASIEILRLLGKTPLVVTKDLPADIYAVINATNEGGTKIVSAKSINDASGLPTAGIIGLTAASNNTGSYFVAPVKKNDGNFGEVGSGLALIKFENFTPNSLDATTGAVLGNKAAPLDCQHPAIKINSPVTVNSNIVDICFDVELSRLYLVLDATSGSGSTDGVRSVVMGKIEKDILTLHPIAPDSVFDAPDKIVGGVGSCCKTSLYKVRTIETSSKIRYLVVASSQPQGNYIYAVPLVDLNPVNQMNPASNLLHGTLANVNCAPVDSFHNTELPNLRARGLVDAAVHPADVFSHSSPQAMVGGSPLPLDPHQRITDIVAKNDAIFVSIGSPLSSTTQPGIFHSQAILDNVGKIVSWTPWKRAYGTQEQVFGMAMDERTHCMWMMTGTSTDLANKVKITEWSNTRWIEENEKKKFYLPTDSNGLLGGTLTDTHVGLTYQIKKELPRRNGGVHNFFVFNEHTPSFGHNPAVVNNQLSLLVATGLGKIVLVETGRNNTEYIFTPNMGDFATGKQKFRDGTLQGLRNDQQTKIITVSGGVVGELGPIIASEISRSPLCDGARHGYLFVGGAHGLAVLCDNNGYGWDTSLNEGLHASFGSLRPDMSFKKLGSFSQVRKLWSDEYYLYVLTNHTFDRIKLSSIAQGSLEIVRLADYESLGLPSFATFYDMGISYKLGLLATSGGLFRVGNDRDISDYSIVSGHDLKWTRVTIPEGHDPVCQLYFISSTHDDNGFAGPGMMYVLTSAYNQSRVNRFFIRDVRNCPITDSTITPLNDFFLKGIHSYLVEFGVYKNFIATDGYALLNARSGSQASGSHVDMYGNFKSAKKYKVAHENFLLLLIENSDKKNRLFSHQGIRHMLRNSSGSWLIGGDFGLRVNE